MDDKTASGKHPILLACWLAFLGAIIIKLVDVGSNIIEGQKFPIVITFVGVQFSVGLSVLLTVFTLVLMSLSGWAGFASFPFVIIKLFSPKTKLPLWVSVFFFAFYPIIWVIDSVDRIRWRNVKSEPPMSWEDYKKLSEARFSTAPKEKKVDSTTH